MYYDVRILQFYCPRLKFPPPLVPRVPLGICSRELDVDPVAVEILRTRISHSVTHSMISVLVGVLMPSVIFVFVSVVPIRLRTLVCSRPFVTKDVATTIVSFLLSMMILILALIPLNIDRSPLSIVTLIVYEVTQEVCVGVEFISLTFHVSVSVGNASKTIFASCPVFSFTTSS